MLNDWSDRQPEPRRARAWPIVVAVLVGIATLAFVAQLVMSMLGY